MNYEYTEKDVAWLKESKLNIKILDLEKVIDMFEKLMKKYNKLACIVENFESLAKTWGPDITKSILETIYVKVQQIITSYIAYSIG